MSMQLARAKCGCSEEVHQHPYIPQGSSCFLCLDMSTLSGGASSTQFLLDQLHLCRLLPYSDTKVFLPQEEAEMGLKVFSHFWEALWQSSEEEHCLSDPIHCQSLCQPPIPVKKRAPRKIRLSSTSEAFTRCQSSQSSAGVWVDPGNTGVGLKIWWLADQTGQEVWEAASMDGQTGRYHLSRGLFPGTPGWLDKVTALVHLLLRSSSLHEQCTCHGHATGRGCPSDHCCTWARGLIGSTPLRQSRWWNWDSTSSSTSLTGYLLCWHSLSGAPICWVLCQPHTRKAGLLSQQLNEWSLWQKDPYWLPRGQG